MFNKFNKNTITRSLPEVKVVHGIKVEKLTLLKYTEALNKLEKLPNELISNVFKVESFSDLIKTLSTMSSDSMSNYLANFFLSFPDIIVQLISALTNTDRETVMNLTPMEILDVITTWWELNDVTNFFKKLEGMNLFTREKTGYNNGSQSQNQ